MNKKLILLVVLILFSLPCFSDSIFSGIGLLEENFGSDTFSSGMGETGIASIFRKNFSTANPALIATVQNVSFSTSLILGYNYIHDEADRTATRSLGYFPYFNLIVPVSQNDFLGLKFSEKLSSGLESSEEYNIPDIGLVNGYDEIKGSLSLLGFTYARSIKDVLVGGSINYYFGNEDEELEIMFQPSLLDGYSEIREKQYHGINFSLGTAIPFGNFSFGGFYSHKINMELNEDYTITYPDNPEFNFKESEEMDIDFPGEIGIGIGFQPNDLFYFEGNYRYTFWESSEYSESANWRTDAWFASLGASYIPEHGTRMIPLRVGAYYKKLPCKINGSFIDEKAVSFGCDVPVKGGNIGLALAWGTRGDRDKHGGNDEFLKLSIGFSSIDRWRNPQKFKKDKEIPELDPKYKKFWEAQ
ncbi:MAG: OmpP1/FadL family transporter [Candidatus Cloacimonadia bacterium]